LAIAVRFVDDAVVLGLRGVVDAHTSPHLKTAILGAAEGPHSEVVLDLSEVTSIDCAGIDALRDVRRQLRVRPSAVTGHVVRLEVRPHVKARALLAAASRDETTRDDERPRPTR
jgi:anti-anti-sigma factor